jgi:hypothetical protein
MSNNIMPYLTQLISASPLLLVYFVGLILALVFWRRCPTPSLLVVIASVLLLLVTVTNICVYQYLLQSRVELGWTHEKLGWALTIVSLTSSSFRAAGMGLILAAVFLQRRVSQSAGPESVMRTAPAPTVS